jgi:signal transduction histidine kinase
VVRIRPSRDWRDRAISGMRITFCDSGVGMDKATRQRMFDPFFTTKTDTGTGLGMWVVSQLVERHKGHIRVWSTQLRDAARRFSPYSCHSANYRPATSVESQVRINAIQS